jgi:hypothetical protein
MNDDGPSPSDMQDWADYDDTRRWGERCRCGGDMPGRCPGPASCPLCQTKQEADEGDAE